MAAEECAAEAVSLDAAQRARLDRVVSRLRDGGRLSREDRALAAMALEAALGGQVEPPRPAVPCFACEGTGRPGAPGAAPPSCEHCHGEGTVPSFWPRLVRSWDCDESFGRPIRRPVPPREATYVKVAAGGRAGRTRPHLGILVGEVALSAAVGIDPSGRMTVTPAGYTPAIYVFAQGEVVYGNECDWQPVTAREHLGGMAEQERATAWYAMALETLPDAA